MDTTWMWAILGLFFIAIELVTGTFYLLCFGISALITAAINNGFGLTSNSQWMIFIALAPIVLVILKSMFKKTEKDLLVGQSKDDSIGKVGHIITPIKDNNHGYISFNMPVMGSKNWMAISDQSLKIGDLAKVVSIEGNYLKVERYKEQEIFKEVNK